MDVDPEDQLFGGQKDFGFPELPDFEMDIDSVHDFECGTQLDDHHKGYLDGITESIQQNDLLVVDELRYLYQSITKSGGDELCRDMLRHGAFLKVLTEDAMLHKDLCVTRFAILILQQISKIKGGDNQLMDGHLNLFGNINKLLCCHRRPLVKKHAIRFLDGLADAPSWNIDEIDQTQLLWRIKEYGKEHGDDEEMRPLVERINGKLAGN